MTAWGDSVMLGARYGLAFDIPGRLRRRGRRAAGRVAARQGWRSCVPIGELGPKVVIHVGDNGLFLRSSLDNALTSSPIATGSSW